MGQKKTIKIKFRAMKNRDGNKQTTKWNNYNKNTNNKMIPQIKI